MVDHWVNIFSINVVMDAHLENATILRTLDEIRHLQSACLNENAVRIKELVDKLPPRMKGLTELKFMLGIPLESTCEASASNMVDPFVK